MGEALRWEEEYNAVSGSEHRLISRDLDLIRHGDKLRGCAHDMEARLGFTTLTKQNIMILKQKNGG